MSENKDNKLTLINEKTANDYLTHTSIKKKFTLYVNSIIIEKTAVAQIIKLGKAVM